MNTPPTALRLFSLALIVLAAPALNAQLVPGRYIVEFAGKPSAGRAAVRSEQARMRPVLENAGARIRASVETIANAMVVELADRDVPRVRALAGVARVHPVRLVKPDLNRALPLHRVPEAWAAIGGMEKAGAGVKIGIIDSGIDQTHPGFQDSALPMPPGFPLANQPRDLAYTNNKVIVARNYVALATPQDGFGHGTAVAMEAAGVANSGPLGAISGVAPKAWLGSYKVYQDETPFGEDTVLAAIEDAVNDGMDVLNLSLGVSIAGRIEDDVLVAAVERASALGVVVCVAAGNYGGAPNTITSPATAPSAIAVGAAYNDRTFAPGLVQLAGGSSYYAIPASNGTVPALPITANLVDAAAFDRTGQVCAALPANSLNGAIAVILRSPQDGSGCSFAYKLNNAQKAGAVAAIVYMNADSPALVGMDVRGSTLPAVSVDNTAGMDLRSRIAAGAAATVQFTTAGYPQNPNVVAPFSSRGPNVNAGIKPDLLATGLFIYTATQKTNSNSSLYGATGYLKEADGTSFAAPLAAGAAALLKGARPGLTAAQYKSLVVNNAAALAGKQPQPVQWTGAGSLDAAAAVGATLVAAPVSLSFGAGGATVDAAQDLVLTNLGTADDIVSLSAVPAGAGPSISLSAVSVRIAAGASQTISARLTGTGLGAGEYQGWLHLRSMQTGIDSVIPYWYGASDGVPNLVTELAGPDAAAPGSVQDVYFRVTDRSGMAVAGTTPTMRVMGLSGSVLAMESVDHVSPGVFHAIVLLGPFAGVNVFEIDAGAVSAQITIQGASE